MKATLITGILLIVMGVVSLAFDGIPYKRDTDEVSVGPIQASAETTKKIPLPPVLSGLVVVGRLTLIAVGIGKAKR